MNTVLWQCMRHRAYFLHTLRLSTYLAALISNYLNFKS
jgi:hypothetical protein